MSARSDCPADEDRKAQQAVLGLLLDVYPALLSIEEVERTIAGHEEDLGPLDAVEIAIRELVGVGLVDRHDRFVFATRAAVRFEEIKF
jgi:hypothetical protein